jgi:predicted ATPase
MDLSQLSDFRLKNFKAVRDSGKISFTPLTAFIGYNGSGKSSIVEGLSTFQAIVEDGLDKAMQQWRGFEYVWNQSSAHEPLRGEGKRPSHTNAMGFELWGHNSSYHHDYHATMELNTGPKGQELFIQSETLEDGILYQVTRNDRGSTLIEGDLPDIGEISEKRLLGDGKTIFSDLPYSTFNPKSWQFVALEAHAMGHPVPQSRTTKEIRLATDGSNLAEYLLSIRKLDQDAFEGIVETLQAVLPYVNDLHPILTSELERAVYLQFAEDSFKVPGWLMSTGTLRILALLALLRHPKPAPLIVIE